MRVKDSTSLIEMGVGIKYLADEWEIDFDSILKNYFLNFLHQLVLFLAQLHQPEN
jgi:hypothetical protein